MFSVFHPQLYSFPSESCSWPRSWLWSYSLCWLPAGGTEAVELLTAGFSRVSRLLARVTRLHVLGFISFGKYCCPPTDTQNRHCWWKCCVEHLIEHQQLSRWRPTGFMTWFPPRRFIWFPWSHYVWLLALMMTYAPNPSPQQFTQKLPH